MNLRSGFSKPGDFDKPTKLKNNSKMDKTSPENAGTMATHVDGPIPSSSNIDMNVQQPQLPADQPQWFKQVMDKLSLLDTVHSKISKFEESFKRIEHDISELNTSINFASKKADDATLEAQRAMEAANTLQKENNGLKNEITSLKTRIIQQELQSRRNNLIFYGIPEKDKESWIDCEKSVCDIIGSNMGIENAQDIEIERAHRLGVKQQNKTRGIIVKFCKFKDREIVWKKAKTLAKTNHKLSEDYPAEVLAERRVLYPIYKLAVNNKSYKEVSLKVDKLYINRKAYSSINIHELPPELHPKVFATKITKDVAIFASQHSPLSNFYSEAEIRIDLQTYCSTEQFYQSEKASFFNDDITHNKILAENDPYKISDLGKRIKNYDESLWKPHVRQTLLKANRAKYEQVPIARSLLLSTNDLPLGEATKNPVFGIGLHVNDPKALNIDNWSSDGNLFGEILAQIRSELQTKYSAV